jgi:hypothetical protein
MALTFQPPEFRDKLAKALLIFQKLSEEPTSPGDFGLIDLNDPDFDPADHPDEAITPTGEVTVCPPDSGETFRTSYGELIEMLYEARLAQVDANWQVCCTPRRALIHVRTDAPESGYLAEQLVERNVKVAQEHDGSEIWVRLVSGLNTFAILAALSGNYFDADVFPSVSRHHLFVEIYRPHRVNAAYPHGPAPPEFSEQEARALSSAFLFELNQALGLVLVETSLSTTWEYPDEEAIAKRASEVQLRPLLTGPGMAELLRHFNEGVRASSPEIAVLAFAKIFEFVSATIIRERLIQRARQKLLSERSRSPDSTFILELQALFESERSLRQDRPAVILTTRTCCDAWELQPLAPRCCKKLADLKDEANEKDRDAALDSFGECIVSTRNMLSHSKANYEPTGNECPETDLSDLVKCLRASARQVIHYFHGVHPDRRVV